MKYHNNGMLRAEQDSTLWLRPASRKSKVTWLEYFPLVILGILMVFLLVKGLFG